MEWVSDHSFVKFNLKPNQFFFELEPFNTAWINKKLDYEKHDILYEYIFDGGKSFFRPNRLGKIELMTEINLIQPISLLNAAFQLSNVSLYNNIFSFDLIFYTNTQTILRMPFIFDLSVEVQKYCAAALCEQKDIPFYILKLHNNKLYVICCKKISWSKKTRQTLRSVLLSCN